MLLFLAARAEITNKPKFPSTEGILCTRGFYEKNKNMNEYLTRGQHLSVKELSF
jgi:hypothetical protein